MTRHLDTTDIILVQMMLSDSRAPAPKIAEFLEISADEVEHRITNLLKEGIATVDMRYQNGLALSAHGLSVPNDITKPVKAVTKKTNSTSSTNRNKQ
jgi:DNA-binding Lrp family transcriptional regulator